MDFAEIRRLVKLVESSDIHELEIKDENASVRIMKRPTPDPVVAPPNVIAYAPESRLAPPTAPPTDQPAPAPEPAPVATNSHQITSPMVGTYYRAPSPEAPPYVQVGDRVRPGQTLCIVEAMKLMNEIESEVSGVIKAIEVENAQPVEFGQILFRIELD